MQRSYVSVWSLSKLLAPLGFCLMFCLAAGSLRAQPANDNFASATVLVGPSGSTNASNIGASREAGEPNITGNAGGESIWYSWTAPANLTVTFNTVGSDFDTLLGIYTGTAVNALTLVGENDNFGSVLQSSVTFVATAGVTYYIAVDGYNAGGGASQGTVVLNWGTGSGAALKAGDFRFTSSYYPFSETESFPPRSAVMLYLPARATITRVGGSAGRVIANYTISGGLYTNFINLMVEGTNIFMTNNSVTPPAFTNITITNITAAINYQNYQYGRLSYASILNFTNFSFTNINGGLNPGSFITNNAGAVPVVDCANSLDVGTIVDTNATPPVVVTFITNAFCTNYIITNIVSSTPLLTNGLSGSVTFDDYQMSADIFVPSMPPVVVGGLGNGGIIGGGFVGFLDPTALYLDSYIQVSIDSVTLDPLESPKIAPPTASSAQASTVVEFLNEEALAFTWHTGENDAHVRSALVAATNVFNFERATIRCSRDVFGPGGSGGGIAHVYVSRTSLDYSGSCTVNYRIDHRKGLPTIMDNGNNIFGMEGQVVLNNILPGTLTGFFDVDEIPLQPGSDYAYPPGADPERYDVNPDFQSVTGQLSWGGGDGTLHPIDIPITNWNQVEFNEDLSIELYFPGNDGPGPTSQGLGMVHFCTLTILYNNIATNGNVRDVVNSIQPAGAVDRVHEMDNFTGTTPPYNLHPGANGTVFAVAVQPNQSTVLAGDFTAFNTVPRIRIARMDFNGELDPTFNPPGGANLFISSLALDGTGKIVAGGAFTSMNGVPRARIARLQSDGTLDTSFFPGAGADGTIWNVAIQQDGRILISGEFATFNGVPRMHIARLNPDGSLDASFDPGIGPDDVINAMALQADGRIIIGGAFMNVDNTARAHVARLNADGSLDTSFNPGYGADDVVYTLAMQVDNKALMGGAFHNVGALSRNGVARLNTNGTVDQSFDPGDGADDTVYSITVQPDSNIILGGTFKSYNQTRRVALARIFSSGSLDTSFMDTAYNQFAGLINHYWDPAEEPANFIFSSALQADGNIIIGGGFTRVGGGFTRDDIRNRNNVARIIGGSTPGPGSIEFAAPSFTADQFSQQLFIPLVRLNGHLGQASVNLVPSSQAPGPGVAVDGLDYTFDSALYGQPTYVSSWRGPDGFDTWKLSDALFGQNQGYSQTANPATDVNSLLNKAYINILDNTNIAGNRQLDIKLSNPSSADIFFLGGENIPTGLALGRSTVPLTLVDYHTLPGVLGFSSAGYLVNEGGTNAVISVTRTNGTAGLVSVKYATANGTATNGIHYRAVSGNLQFLPGETNKTFLVPIIDESTIEHDHTVLLTLAAPGGGATLGLSNAVLTIIDNDVVGGYVQFSSATYGTNENAVYALVTVDRNGGGLGTMTAQFTATNGTAVGGFNFTPITNTLTWVSGDAQPKTIPIQIFDDGVVQTNPLTINLRVSTVTVNGVTNSLALGSPNTATLYITNSDFPGQVSFTAASYSINENGGPAIIPVVRTGGTAGSIAVNFATLPGSSTPGVDFFPTNGTLFFGPGELSKVFTVNVINTPTVDPPRFITLALTGANPANSLGSPSTAILNILDKETFFQPPGGLDTTLNPSIGFNDSVQAMAFQPDGKILAGGDFTLANGLSRNRIARLNSDGTLDASFSSTVPGQGANGTVLSIVCQTDRRVLIAGAFTRVNGVSQNYLARLNSDGTLDTTFNTGSAADNSVFGLAETFVGADRKLLVGGSFQSFNAQTVHNLVRLNDNGFVDSTFLIGTGPDGNVFSIVVQPDRKVLIGGDFSAVNGVGRNHVARLNADGSVDLSFDPGAGPSGSVRAIALQPDGRVLLGGVFTNVNGIALNHIARLNLDGSVDATFSPGIAANDSVTTISMQTDTRILLGGQFTLYDGVTRNRLTRLNADGTVDSEINFGDGANSFVAATLIQTNGLILFGGGFTQYDDQPRQHFARIYGGSVDGSGTLEFAAPYFQVNEDGTNGVVTVRRRGGTTGSVSVTFSTSDGSALAGINYSPVTTNLTFPNGEVFESVAIPVFRDYVITTNLAVNLNLSNPTGGADLGNLPTAQLTLINVDSGVSFASSTYSAPENALSGFAQINLVRIGGTNGTASVGFYTATNGTAIANTNYIPVSNIVSFAAGQTSAFVNVPVLHTPAAEGNTTVIMQLTNAINALLLAPSTATLTVVDVDQLAGQFVFSQTNYVVSEAAGAVNVTILRTNGYTGSVSVTLTTAPITAQPGINYVSTSNTVTFADGEISKTVSIPIIETHKVQGNTTFSVVLSNPTGGANISTANTSIVTIIDDNTGVAFSSPIYIVTETAGSVTLAVNRIGTNGITTVSYATTNGTAIAGTNYLATSGTLVFNPGEFLKTFQIPVLHDPRVTGPLSFTVTMFDPSAPAQIFANNPALVTINDADAGFAFTNSAFYAIKSGTNVLISVIRSNANTGIVSVNYATSDGTAAAGVDYTATTGVLTFSNGIGMQSFSVPIINNSLVEGDRTFYVGIFNPSPPAQLLVPNIASVTITDNVAGLSFSAPLYKVNENGGAASITVRRTGFTNSTVSVDYATADGTAQAGANYISVSGTFVFTNGETVKTFAVPVIDDGIPNGDKTVLLTLGNVSSRTARAVLLSPNAATLTILETDGSLILPAGTALLSESGPVNNNIDPGETVSMLFAFRNASGTNTQNLIGTLLATNGISNPSGPQNFGALAVHGPSVSRPYTFTANATNGQTITATFLFQDGNAPTNLAVVSFVVGQLSMTFSNTAPIVINDYTNATPYPSIINVRGLPGAITKATVMLTNVYHTWPRDIDTLLVAPGGPKSYLMAKTGGSMSLQNVTLTFDDAASSFLPAASQIVSGTYRPTSYASVPPPFPTPAPPSTLASPYATNLAALVNSNPNGPWSLFVVDDTPFNSGIISNGWWLNLITADTISGNADLGVSSYASPQFPIATSNLTYTVTVTNYGPSTAVNVLVTDTLPVGSLLLSSNASQGAISFNGSQLTWTIPSLAKDAYASLSFILQPLTPGLATNVAVVSSSTSDLNPEDDIDLNILTVLSPTADLALALAGAPNPVVSGKNVTFTMTVTNLGPATAPQVVLTDILPPGIVFVSASPGGYSLNGNIVTFTNLGDLGSGTQVSAQIVVTTSGGGTLTNTASTSSSVIDPLKLNNTASIKIEVEQALMTITQSGNTLTISWPADFGNYVLEETSSLTPPVVWTPVTSPSPTLGGGMKTVVLQVGTGTTFFRLHGQAP